MLAKIYHVYATAFTTGTHNITFINICNLALLITELRITHKIYGGYKIRTFNEKKGL